VHCKYWLWCAGGIVLRCMYNGVSYLLCRGKRPCKRAHCQFDGIPAAGTQQTSSQRESESSVDSQQGVGTSGLPPHLAWLMGDEDKPGASATEAATPNS
jgi:hypothetical protein